MNVRRSASVGFGALSVGTVDFVVAEDEVDFVGGFGAEHVGDVPIVAGVGYGGI